MAEDIKVGISAYAVAQAPDKLLTLGLGSCIAILIYDERFKIGGLSHIMLPESGLFKAQDEVKAEKFADLAIPAMVKELKQRGPSLNLVAKIAGGASMFQLSNQGSSLKIGERNTVAVKKALAALNIPLLASHTGGNMGRSLFVDLATMKVTVKMVNRELIDL